MLFSLEPFNKIEHFFLQQALQASRCGDGETDSDENEEEEEDEDDDEEDEEDEQNQAGEYFGLQEIGCS
jgi:hypothetical protein